MTTETKALALYLPLLSLLLAPAAVAGWGDRWDEEELFERTVAAAPGTLVTLENTNGGVEVRSWDRAEVHVRAAKRARAHSRDEAYEILRETEIDVSESSGRLDIETVLPRSRRKVSVAVEYEISVPRDADLRIDLTNGGIDVGELDGSADLETVNGGIYLAGVAGEIRAHTTNGAIEAEILGGVLTEPVDLSTTNGAIELTLEEGVAASVEARARNGVVETDFPVTVQGRLQPRSLDFDLAGGGPRISLSTSNGRIHVRRR